MAITTKGKHSCEMLVPKFFSSKLCTPTVTAVIRALEGSPARSMRDVYAMAAFIWYSRSNGRAWFFSPRAEKSMEADGYTLTTEAKEVNAQNYHAYWVDGVYPIDPKRLQRIKLSTLLKYRALLSLD